MCFVDEGNLILMDRIWNGSVSARLQVFFPSVPIEQEAEMESRGFIQGFLVHVLISGKSWRGEILGCPNLCKRPWEGMYTACLSISNEVFQYFYHVALLEKGNSQMSGILWRFFTCSLSFLTVFSSLSFA